jgi:hypothetical protein
MEINAMIMSRIIIPEIFNAFFIDQDFRIFLYD